MIDLTMSFDVANGVARLLAQPGDVGDHPEPALRRYEAAEEHRRLFDDYVNDLRLTRELAVAWWEGTVDSYAVDGAPRQQAIDAAIDVRLAGPASHPSVVYMVRTYWLLCAAENGGGPDVHPATFLLQWLVDEGRDDLVELLACMPYWPVGLDAEGNWC